ncbi:hypothetical protein OSB04_029798 [Centaurea solstitialis]|uniref:Uncharacterized protein n=1 Tax=Centaurea solstitialis TaxID=347529 RepID=A0AA38W379_9ASTR|nr:hypothetical protein OSB04_029798 [Centaurea solstitialis]
MVGGLLVDDSGNVSVYKSDYMFTVMMVTDGCFILELLYRFQYGIAEADPVFDNMLMLQEVKSDLLLLENQIPLLILKELFCLTVKQILKTTSLTDLILYFFKDMSILKNIELTKIDERVEHCHILGLLQSCYKPKPTAWKLIPAISFSATEIAGAGVKFKANTDETFLLAVTFEQPSDVPSLGTPIVKDTTFTIPVLCIKYFTVSFLRNLIAYEQCYPLSQHYVTSFASLMDRLIETDDDVSLLVKSGVLQHNLGACKDVTTLFNNICNGVC